MNMKKKMKAFFTMKRHANEGFTLVELIVVIAILAILAGVAVPAYSGYIEKANRAADEQLLSAVNTAFAAACAINGTDVSEVNSATAVLGADKTVTDVYRTAAGDDYSVAFSQFYAGNDAAAFKVINSLVFDSGKHAFVDPSNVDSLTVSYGGNTVTVPGEVIQTLQDSTFGDMGGEALLDEIAGLTNMMSGDGENSETLASTLLGDAAYMASFAKYLGYTGDLADQDEVKKFIMAQQEDKGGKLTDTQLSNAMVNGMVFYAAEGMKDYSEEDAYDFVSSGNIFSNLDSDPATKLAQASLAYGVYAGFVNSEFNKGDTANGVGKAESATSDPMGAIQNISGNGAHSANFKAYIESDQGKADVKAYMEAMKVINDVSGTGAGAGVLVNGFEDSELSDLLTQVLGK